MIKDYVPAQRKTEIRYNLTYDDGHNNGYAFPCDENGNLLLKHEAAKENLSWCKDHAYKFVRAGVIVTEKYRYLENAHGTCKCGERVELCDEYYGACQCPKCGQWYNLFGQELLPPDQWEENLEEDY